MYFYKNLVNICDQIIYTGKNLSIYKNQQEVAKGWDDPCFAVALNEEPEVGKVELLHYSHEGEHPNKEFLKLLIHHELTSHQDIGIVEQSITYEKDLNIDKTINDKRPTDNELITIEKVQLASAILHLSKVFLNLLR